MQIPEEDMTMQCSFYLRYDEGGSMNMQKLHTGTTSHPVPARAELHAVDREKKWTERTLSVPPDPLPLHPVTLPLAEWNKGRAREKGFQGSL